MDRSIAHSPKLKALLDRESYRTGSPVNLRLVGDLAALCSRGGLSLYSRIGRKGEPFRSVRVHPVGRSSNTHIPALWQIPADAETGRYVALLELRTVATDKLLWASEELSFAVRRVDISIQTFHANRRFYFEGDPIAFELTLANDGFVPQKSLVVEVGEAQYPWITPAKDTAGALPVISTVPFDLAPGESRSVSIHALARCGEGGSSVQYTAVVRPSRSSRILAFRSTPSIFVRCEQEVLRPVYPPAYIHSDLSQVRTGGYREFYGGKYPIGRVRSSPHVICSVPAEPDRSAPAIRARKQCVW